MKNIIKITDKERIKRILHRICDSNLKLFIRTQNNPKVVIRSTAMHAYLNEQPSKLLLSKISLRGIEMIRDERDLTVEFIMMSSKIIFKSKLISVSGNSVYISIPNSLVNIERRQNMRYPISLDNAAYFELFDLKKNLNTSLSLPTYPQYKYLESRVLLADISLGGACAVSHFPYLKESLTTDSIDHHAKLYLPLRAPIQVPIEVRWYKKIREHFESRGGKDNSITTYKVGLQFLEDFVTDDVKAALIQYINELSHSQAV